MKKIVIWGAGKKGIGLSSKLRRSDILYFCDSDNNKVGCYINGYIIKKIDSILDEKPEGVELVTTIPCSDPEVFAITQQWDGDVYWYEDYCSLPEVKKQIDMDLLSRYYLDFRLRDSLYIESNDNWFREDYFSFENKKLILAIKNKNENEICQLMNMAYNSGDKYFDEYIDMRPGMRLIQNIIINEYSEKIRVVDFACGHGELIKSLSSRYDTYAIDYSVDRIKELEGVNAFQGNVTKTNFPTDFFDVSICMECLEHVDDTIELSEELIRVTKKGGKIIVTVPYLKQCDDEMHVRHFNVINLWGLFNKKCKVENLLVIPYLNYTSDDNLIIVLTKIR
jgi:hypothetical protein